MRLSEIPAPVVGVVVETRRFYFGGLTYRKRFEGGTNYVPTKKRSGAAQGGFRK